MFVQLLCLEWLTALRRLLTLQLCPTGSVSAAFHNDDGTNQPRTTRMDVNLDASYFKIYPLKQHFIEVSDSTIVGNWKWPFVNGCECKSSIYVALIFLKCYTRKYQCVQGIMLKSNDISGEYVSYTDCCNDLSFNFHHSALLSSQLQLFRQQSM